MWPALVVFSLYWIATGRQQRSPWPEIAVTLLVQLAVLGIIAWLLPDWVWKTVLLAYITLTWWIVPFQVWRTTRQPVLSGAVPYDPDQHEVWPELRAEAERQADVLGAAGLVRLGAFWHRHPAGMTMLRVMMESPDGLEVVMVTGHSSVMLEGTAAEVRSWRVHCAYGARFADGRRLGITNEENDSPGTVRGVRAEYMPSLRDPARLLAFARAYRARFMADAPLLPARDGLPPMQHLEAQERRYWQDQLGGGWFRLVPDGQVAPTLRYAVVSVLGMQAPLRQLAGLRLRMRERRLLRTLGVTPQAPAGQRWWLRPGDHVGAAALAMVFVLVVPFPSLPPVSLALPAGGMSAAASLRPAQPYRLPDGFAVPADFPGAVRALEQLAGTLAVPLEVVDDWPGEVRRSDGFEVRVKGDLRDSMVAHAGPLFRARGFLLFKGDHTYNGMAEYVALLPRDDHAEAIRLIGTSGPNYGIYTDSVVSWFGALHARHPFAVVGVGHDYLEGRFARPPTRDETRALAREFYAFCPDIVTQGTETVAALAREMERDRIVYCWWD